jgi:DNA invertase Pin-like site-specific DNA recombinase
MAKANEGSKRVVAIYSRVSGDEQADKGHSLQTQRALGERLAELSFTGCPVRIFEDVASARNGRRKGLDSLVGLIRKGLICGVISTDFDRIWRSQRDAMAFLDTCARHRCRVIVHGFGLDTSTAIGRLVAGIIALFAEHESRVIGERTARVHAESKRLGKRGPGHRPYGWSVDQEGFLVRNEEEQQCIAWVLSQRATGSPWARIAQNLNGLGRKPVRGRAWSGEGARVVFQAAAARIQAMQEGRPGA